MGIFDKSKKSNDSFESPVEFIDLSAGAAASPAPAAKPAAPAPPAEASVAYGIDKAIELMRQLPSENVELVVQVVKTTLESIQVKVATIIQDGNRKLATIEGRIGTLKGEIAELDSEIAKRKQTISELETDHRETTTVKERLVLAEKLSREIEAKTAVRSSAPSAPPSAMAAGQQPVSGIAGVKK